jgi:hypothetical protein
MRSVQNDEIEKLAQIINSVLSCEGWRLKNEGNGE